MNDAWVSFGMGLIGLIFWEWGRIGYMICIAENRVAIRRVCHHAQQIGMRIIGTRVI